MERIFRKYFCNYYVNFTAGSESGITVAGLLFQDRDMYVVPSQNSEDRPKGPLWGP